MKLYAICLVKNEDDIIAQTLTHAGRYCDEIFIIDNGSTDRTWDIVQELSSKNQAIVPFARRLEPYDGGLRWLAYDARHRELSDEDWWLILDGDEFLAEDPRPIVEQGMKEKADVINAWQIQFYFTERDLQAWTEGSDDAKRPIFARRRWYRIDWQEPRLFRNQRERNVIFKQSKLLAPDTPWGTEVIRRKGKVCRRRILNRHYQYRDPPQIEKRLALRYQHPTAFSHVTSSDWRDVIRRSSELTYHRDGERWRFSLSGLANHYSGWIRYIFINRSGPLHRRLQTLAWGSRKAL